LYWAPQYLKLPSACTRHNLPLEMGKSAKIHKRTVRPPHKPPCRIQIKQFCSPFPIPTATYFYQQQKKKTSNADTGTSTTLTTTPVPTPKPAAAAVTVVASASAKKAKLNSRSRNIRKRAKLGSSSSTGGRRVLGGADYVDLMMGSRRRAREEALKLPRDTDEDVTLVVSESLPTST